MFHHVTVLLNEAIDGLNIKSDGNYVDCTLGGAGHSSLIAEQLSEQGQLIAFDQDITAIDNAAIKLAPFGNRVKLINSNFSQLRQELLTQQVPIHNGWPQVDGILLDLGVSSPQLDDGERGFSYHQDAELDMRMDQSNALSAFQVVNEWPEEELTRILFEYGEEKFARRIAKSIVQNRELKPIHTTSQLADLIKEAIPAAARRTGPHPARRSFQAIRIAVNDELGVLQEVLEQAIDCLAPGGRLVVITFHSLEDRICKHFFAKFVEVCSCPPGFPVCVCRKEEIVRLINRKPIVAGTAELEHNPRARSAKLRIAEKL
jgi:16S rRNA (cytosine1402-N4)-methyltransferase